MYVPSCREKSSECKKSAFFPNPIKKCTIAKKKIKCWGVGGGEEEFRAEAILDTMSNNFFLLSTSSTLRIAVQVVRDLNNRGR